MVKRRKIKKKRKSRPPRLYTDEKGRYIKVKGQKTYIHSPLTSNQLVRVIINNFEKKFKKKKKKKKTKGSLSKGSKSKDHLAELILSMNRLRTPTDDIRSVIGMIPESAAAAVRAVLARPAAVGPAADAAEAVDDDAAEPAADDDAAEPAAAPATPEPEVPVRKRKRRRQPPKASPGKSRKKYAVQDLLSRIAKQVPKKELEEIYLNEIGGKVPKTKPQIVNKLFSTSDFRKRIPIKSLRRYSDKQLVNYFNRWSRAPVEDDPDEYDPVEDDSTSEEEPSAAVPSHSSAAAIPKAVSGYFPSHSSATGPLVISGAPSSSPPMPKTVAKPKENRKIKVIKESTLVRQFQHQGSTRMMMMMRRMMRMMMVMVM